MRRSDRTISEIAGRESGTFSVKNHPEALNGLRSVAPAPTLRSLQVLRGLAASLVVISHIAKQENENWLGVHIMYAPAISVGHIGVFAFFVISGFIMYLTAGADFGKPNASAIFLVKRIARIVPLYWICTALAVALPLTLFWRPVSPLGFALSCLFLPDTTNLPTLYPVLPVGWTLNFEMLFYIVFGACLMLPRYLGLLAITLIFIYPGPQLLYLAKFSPVLHLAQWWAQRPIMLFAIGIWLGVAAERFGRGRSGFPLGFSIAVAIFVAAPIVMLVRQIPDHEILEMAISAAVVALCVLTRDIPATGLTRPLINLGDASYSLYLTHTVVLGLLSAAWLKVVGAAHPIAFGAVALVFSSGVAWLVHLYAERPLTVLLRDALSRGLLGAIRTQTQRISVTP
jgi:exopolysaccharide production protein ExoZ